MSLEQYSKAPSRCERSQIVSNIVDTINTTAANSKGGGFIKKDRSTNAGQYYTVEEDLAREKISHQYKSSAKAKRKRRRAASAHLHTQVGALFHSNTFVQNRIDLLLAKTTTQQAKEGQQQQSTQQQPPDVLLHQLFQTTNSELLEAFKEDTTLLVQFDQAEKNHEMHPWIEIN